ncbi:MAG TPA: hypothetical protein VGH51_15855 [Candidatus Angelobacter sp.]
MFLDSFISFIWTKYKAQGTSIAALLAPVGVLAFWEYHKAGNVDLKAGLLIALGFTLGGYLGGPVGATHSRTASAPDIWNFGGNHWYPAATWPIKTLLEKVSF